MKFTPTSLADAVLIDLHKLADDRGYFARTFCAAEFAAAGLVTEFPRPTTRATSGPGRCAACISSARRMPRSRWCAACAGRSTT